MATLKGLKWHLDRYGFIGTFFAISSKIRGIKYTPKIPRVLHIELNNTCNLKCEMCPREHLIRPCQNMDFNLYQKIITQATNLGIKHVRLFLFGEPLLYPRLIEAIKFAKEKGVKHVDFNTNANLLTEEMSEKILSSGLDAIIFSVDGFSKATYERIRKKGNYDECINNILFFLKLKKEKDIKITTSIQTINFEAIKEEINRYIIFWKDRVDEVNVTGLNPMQGLVDEITYLNNKRIVCDEPFSKMVILSDGQVTTCCDDFNGELSLGNIQNNTISEIWKGAKWQKLRKNFMRLNYADYSICEKCFMSYERS